MKKIVTLMALAILMATMAPAAAQAADKKEKKAWKWEMPKKMTGNEDFDLYLRTCDTLNTRVTSYMDSVTFYSVKKIKVTQADGSTIERRCVVDENGHIRGSNEALAQYIAMTNAGLDILNDLTGLDLSKLGKEEDYRPDNSRHSCHSRQPHAGIEPWQIPESRPEDCR